MKVLLKDGVTLEGVEPEIYFALGAAAMAKMLLYKSNPTSDMVVTSLKDGVHPGEGPTHGHHVGLACDLRTRDMESWAAELWLDYLKELLNPMGYYSQLEGSDTPNATAAHLHIQYNPENRPLLK